MYGHMWCDPGARRAPHRLLARAWAPTRTASQGSLLACPDVLGEIDGIRARGGKVVVVDPRRTGTADRADEWLPIVPGTDAAFLLAIVQRALRRRTSSTSATVADLVERRRRACARVAAEFTPEARRGDAAGSPPTRSAASRASSRPRRAPRSTAASASATRSSARSRRGSSTSSTSSPATSTVPGGMMFGKPVAWSVRVAAASRASPTASRSAAGRAACAARPRCSARCRCRASPRRSRRRATARSAALVTIAGNPVISAPDAGRLDAALPELDCMISVDNWLERDDAPRARDPARASRALEQPHFDDLIWMWAVRSAGNCSPAIFPPPADRPARVGDPHPARRAVCTGHDRRRHRRRRDRRRLLRRARARCRASTPRRRCRCTTERRPGAHARPQIRTGPFGDRYGENPDGLTLAVVQGRTRTASTSARWCRACARSWTRPSGKIELAPPYITADVAASARRASTATADGARARQPPPPALEQLVDAQREGAREGQGPLHAAHPPRRRGARRRRRRRARARHARRPAAIEVAGRGQRRDDAGRRLAPPRLGPRQARARGSRSRASTPA